MDATVNKVESDVGPFGAKYQPKPPCVTQNKTKRANKIAFLLLVQDQAVGGIITAPEKTKQREGLHGKPQGRLARDFTWAT